jgi:heat-inducible transcriptional repressor
MMVSRISSPQSKNLGVTDSRGQAVLSAIIKEHLATGEPVGSRTISDRFAHASGWSAATIRNVMGQLEEAGLVEQPHTSAGRVPTDKGYRFYVDNMLGQTRLSKADLSTINAFLQSLQDEAGGVPDRLMAKISHALSEFSTNVGIVISPALADNRLQHIEFLQLADSRVLVILVSAPNIVHHKIIRLNENLSQEELEQTARYLNTEFGGKSLLVIRSEIVEMMREEKALYDRLLRNAILLCNRSLEGETDAADVYVDGASNILTKPEFADAERMRDLFRTFEEKSRLVKILNECLSREQSFPGEVRVVIGREHAAPSMQNCTLITAPYWMGSETIGTLAVVGPMRIEYERMMAVVNYMARHIEQLLRKETATDLS